MTNNDEKTSETLIRFSNYWRVFLLSLIPWIVILITLQIEVQRNNYDSMLDINSELDNFFWILLGALFFTSVTFTSTSFMATSFISQLKFLTPLLKKKNKLENRKIWYSKFVSDVNSLRWLKIYFVPILVISTIIHYIGYGHKVVDSFGWGFYIITLSVLLWTNILVMLWVGWFMLAQYFHIYKFTKKYDENTVESLKMGLNKSNYPHKDKIMEFLLPRRTESWEIEVDIFNTDNLGGLNPLAKLNLMGVLLMGIVFAVMIPLLIAVNRLIAAILLPVFFLIILSSYYIGINSLREAIRTDKQIKLQRINDKLSKIAHDLIESEGSNIEELQELNERFRILEEMGKRIESIPESPRSLTAIIRIGSSSALPLLSFISVDSLNLFF